MAEARTLYARRQAQQETTSRLGALDAARCIWLTPSRCHRSFTISQSKRKSVDTKYSGTLLVLDEFCEVLWHRGLIVCNEYTPIGGRAF